MPTGSMFGAHNKSDHIVFLYVTFDMAESKHKYKTYWRYITVIDRVNLSAILTPYTTSM